MGKIELPGITGLLEMTDGKKLLKHMESEPYNLGGKLIQSIIFAKVKKDNIEFDLQANGVEEDFFSQGPIFEIPISMLKELLKETT